MMTNNYKENNMNIQSNDELFVEKDGVTHINVHPEGKTDLGKKQAHYTHAPFTHPFLGSFRSMEGFWYYMRSRENLVPAEKRDDKLRYLVGFAAKQYGSTRPVIRYDDFKEDILAANYQKIIQNKKILDAVIKSTLPFTQYYVLKDSGMVVKPQDWDWLCEGLENIRAALQYDQIPQCWLNAEKRYAKAVTDNE